MPGPPPCRPSVMRKGASAKPQHSKMENNTGKVIESSPVMRSMRSDVTRWVDKSVFILFYTSKLAKR